MIRLYLIRPKGAQIEALYELKKCRSEGFDKALVVVATGIGKTYLAAFDSAEYSRILFVAHRDEILIQAEKSFKSVKKVRVSIIIIPAMVITRYFAMILKAIKWLFIEQDVTYWNWSGRNMLFSGLRENSLC